MAQTYPLISCICITNRRPVLLEKAISYFISQNYPNKEMVISYPKGDKLSRELIKNYQNQEIQLISMEREEEESLGYARNQAIAKSKGDYVCTWDDDDWYHSSRLSFQFNSMQTKGSGYQASVLTRIILLDVINQQAYLSFPYTWDGTILCKKEVLMQNQYGYTNKAEDTHVIKFLSSKKMLFHIEDAPFLYVYIYHGKNTWDYKHFEYFTSKSEVLSEEIRKKLMELLTI
ncbi:hypothetical protein DBR43_20315 [Pedobacter sp. KBW06]|uniref:glycosyltransferase family 2 protein n=1 Tax=Pedobacter sp. KBW06 TaxID=2153359 RepID=UPI000F5A97E7|nr:glycosyltransferase [Pedobacter sp. KBW06]RQO70366.1 hypothetical protein DBR43_20315 [Pedobacter sp. KBW06]